MIVSAQRIGSLLLGAVEVASGFVMSGFGALHGNVSAIGDGSVRIKNALDGIVRDSNNLSRAQRIGLVALGLVEAAAGGLMTIGSATSANFPVATLDLMTMAGGLLRVDQGVKRRSRPQLSQRLKTKKPEHQLRYGRYIRWRNRRR